MDNRRTLFGVVGVVLAVIGLAALWLPVGIDRHTLYGFPIECGNGFRSHLADLQNDGGEVVNECHSALLIRRAWAIPSVALGWLLVTAFLIAWARAAPPLERTAAEL